MNSREPLDAGAIRAAAVTPAGLWREVQVVGETGSTNSDLLARARDGSPEGLVLVAETQSAARGRMGRSWVSPPRAALAFSVLLRPDAVPPARRGWLPLLAGVAVASSLRAVAAVQATLKWPNDVLAGDRKLAGILAEQAAGAVVIGAGVNVSAGLDELPAPGLGALPAGSLALAGASCLDRSRLLAGMLEGLERWYSAWAGQAGDAGACGLRAEYRQLCVTLGREVRVEMPGGAVVSGLAADIDTDGRLLVAAPSGPVAVSAGDVIHVR